jgi:hypothetical protein
MIAPRRQRLQTPRRAANAAGSRSATRYFKSISAGQNGSLGNCNECLIFEDELFFQDDTSSKKYLSIITTLKIAINVHENSSSISLKARLWIKSDI